MNNQIGRMLGDLPPVRFSGGRVNIREFFLHQLAKLRSSKQRAIVIDHGGTTQYCVLRRKRVRRSWAIKRRRAKQLAKIGKVFRFGF